MRAIVHGPPRSSGTLQVLVDAEIGEDAPPLRHVADAGCGDPDRSASAWYPVPKIVTRPSRGGREAHQAAQGRGLAGAVAAEQRGDLAFRDLEADAMQDMALAVIGVQAFGDERCGHAAFPR